MLSAMIGEDSPKQVNTGFILVVLALFLAPVLIVLMILGKILEVVHGE